MIIDFSPLVVNSHFLKQLHISSDPAASGKEKKNVELSESTSNGSLAFFHHGKKKKSLNLPVSVYPSVK